MLVSTGLKMGIPVGYDVQIRPRSGLALKHGVTVLASPGTIDRMYRGVVGVILRNHGDEPFRVETSDRIAQIVVGRLAGLDLVEVNSLGDTERGAGGFVSTGMTCSDKGY